MVEPSLPCRLPLSLAPPAPTYFSRQKLEKASASCFWWIEMIHVVCLLSNGRRRHSFSCVNGLGVRNDTKKVLVFFLYRRHFKFLRGKNKAKCHFHCYVLCRVLPETSSGTRRYKKRVGLVTRCIYIFWKKTFRQPTEIATAGRFPSTKFKKGKILNVLSWQVKSIDSSRHSYNVSPQKTLAFNSCWCRMACGSRGIAGEEGRLKLFEEFPFFVCPFSILLS